MKFNPNKIFPFLSIRKKLIIAFTLLSFIPLITLGIIGISVNIQSMQEIALENLSHEVTLFDERAQRFLTNVHQDIEYLYQSEIFKQYVESIVQNKKNEIEHFYKLTAQHFLTLAKIKKNYYQLRFIDVYSNEKIIVQYADSSFSVIPEKKLGSGRSAFYFFLLDSLIKNQIVFTPVELIDEDKNQIPAITFALRIYNQTHEFSGILIVNVFAKEFFKIFESDVKSDLNKKIAIVSSEGYYLYHSEKKKDWNRLLSHREKDNLFNEYPEEFCNAILSGKRGIISNGHQEIVAYAPLFQTQFIEGSSYYIFESVRKKNIFSPVDRFAIISGSLIFIFLILSVFLGLLGAENISGSIRKLHKKTQIIANGDYSQQVTIDTNDEIELLAGQVNSMAHALNEREKIIKDHQKKLEEIVIQRTSELQNEKEKLQAIFDNVPSAFILIDQNDNIISASAAIKSISNLSQKEVVGKKCFEVYRRNSNCEICPRRNSFDFQKLIPQLRLIKQPDGKSNYIEQINIPLGLNNHDKLTLEILTDVTDRKKLEEHLLKMEKLAATGEMSAVIAHEMRNSLTSVKMILQLQKESSQQKDDKHSLEVAINSIYRMEEVVNSLLRFARPAPFEYQTTDMNKLIEESLVFVQPHFKKKRIIIQRNLDKTIPKVYIDPQHIKEALINVLLNAVQATEEKKQLFISTEMLNMLRKVEDYAYSETNKFKQNAHQLKVKLDKGTVVICIKIRDNGSGIPKKNLNKIFDPFFTTKLGGTGLGLTMVKRIINQHEGIVQVESSVENGTTLIILLPIKEK